MPFFVCLFYLNPKKPSSSEKAATTAASTLASLGRVGLAVTSCIYSFVFFWGFFGRKEAAAVARWFPGTTKRNLIGYWNPKTERKRFGLEPVKMDEWDFRREMSAIRLHCCFGCTNVKTVSEPRAKTSPHFSHDHYLSLLRVKNRSAQPEAWGW